LAEQNDPEVLDLLNEMQATVCRIERKLDEFLQAPSFCATISDRRASDDVTPPA
jgi:hypothetical protein